MSEESSTNQSESVTKQLLNTSISDEPLPESNPSQPTASPKSKSKSQSQSQSHFRPHAKPPKRKTNNDPFGQKKKYILQQVALTDSEHPDASPKGTIDEHCLEIIHLINKHEDMFTTSSCSGRVSVFLEGDKVVHFEGGNEGNQSKEGGRSEGDGSNKDELSNEVNSEKREKIGGKGAGGKWLFVTHEPKELETEKWLSSVKAYHEENPMTEDTCKRYLLYKFEAMVSFFLFYYWLIITFIK